jgi:hypothetical protein
VLIPATRVNSQNAAKLPASVVTSLLDVARGEAWQEVAGQWLDLYGGSEGGWRTAIKVQHNLQSLYELVDSAKSTVNSAENDQIYGHGQPV